MKRYAMVTQVPYRNPETTSDCERENSSGLPPSNRGQENDHATLDKERRSIMTRAVGNSTHVWRLDLTQLA